MTDSKKKNETLRVDARVRRRETVKSPAAVVWKIASEVVAFVPTYRESREGRNKRNSIKLVILVIGAGLLFAGGTADTGAALWLILGALIAASALVLPVEDLKKRTLRTKLRKKQEPQKKAVWVSGSVVYDGRKVEVHTDEKRVGHVSLKRGKHTVEARRGDGETCLGVLPMSQKVKDGVWICTDDAVSAETSAKVEAEEMKNPARVDGADWEKLWERLNDES